ncbi:MAG: glycoside hydrolase family 27 protein [Clostridia bacterium]|nr:glycoside hydrolase family 27 protein [Clostridia bacterium]
MDSLDRRAPMGWNSWDCYGPGLTEEQLLANAAVLRDRLAPAGYEYVVCDIQWSEPGAKSKAYRPFAPLCTDGFGRLMPAPGRFPSAKDGAGFRPLADRIHAMGLKFGIHIMRGIPRQAVEKDLPVHGTGLTARSCADPSFICPWNPDMYSLREGAPMRAYYDSVFRLYASWDVDFIKMDDVCVLEGRVDRSGVPGYGAADVEAVAAAIKNCGRPMVLSLSPGPARLENAWHMSRYADMWRLTGDFWDTWEQLLDMFDVTRRWDAFSGEGFPDCDMLPLGVLDVNEPENGGGGRGTRFTPAEQRTMMALWCSFGSPLFVGAELTKSDPAVFDLLTDPLLLDMHRYGARSREVSREGGIITRETGDIRGGKFVCRFNVTDAPAASGGETIPAHGAVVKHEG